MSTKSTNCRNPACKPSAGILALMLLVSTVVQGQSTDGYPEGRYPPPPRMGQWAALQMFVFSPLGKDLLSTNTYWGMDHVNSWHDLYIETSSGTLFLVSKSVSRANANEPFTLPFAISFKSSPTGLVINTCDRPWTGPVEEQLTPDDHITRTVSNATGEREVITFGPQRFVWKSQDPNYINVEGTLVTPGTQWMLPWREPSGSTDRLYYQAQYYKVTGTYCGEQIVDGHAQMEDSWSTVGYPNTWWVQNRIGHWTTWTNEYADGSRETGQFLCGEYGARGGVIVDGKGKVLLNTTKANAFDVGEGRIEYVFDDGQRWLFIADPTQALSFGTTLIGNGVFKRIGDNRRIVRHSATHLLTQRLCRPIPLADRQDAGTEPAD